MSFRAFDQLFETDPLNTFQGSLLPDREWERMDVREHYDMIAAIELPQHASEEIRAMFDRARNAVLYSWFAYEISVLGQQYALGTLEAALRSHYQPRGRAMLAKLIRRAVADGTFPTSYGVVDGRPPWLSTVRNFWAHGANSFGTPLLACQMLRECAALIARLEAAPADATP